MKLHQENKTIRQIAEIVHMSFKDIGTIIRRIDGQDNDDDINLGNKSKAIKSTMAVRKWQAPDRCGY